MGGELVPVRRGLPRSLLVALLLRPGQTVSSDWLIDLLWGDDLPRNPANALQIQVSYLRKTLSAADPNGSSLLDTRPGGYSLTIDPGAIDAVRFEAAVRDAVPVDELRSLADLRQAIDEVDAALDLWRGEALEDVRGLELARGEITRLEELRWATIERRTDLMLASGRHSEVVGDLPGYLQQMPLRERLHEQLVLALYRCGRQADALRAYEDARRILVEELGIDPGADLRDLERRVLQQDPALDWTPRAGPSGGVESTGEVVAAPASASTGASGRLPIPLTPLVGREGELARLRELLEAHRVVTLTGPAGAGKSRLAIELAGGSERPVCYVDLSPIDDPALVAATVAAAARLTFAPGEDAVAAIAATLGPQDLLLVLDTCEHVFAAAAQLTTSLLRSGPGVRVLATSRRTLGITGELAWPVPPLRLPPSDATAATEIAAHPAAALFIERASAVRPDLEVDDRTAADIAAICLALDGLPLAIELAAARTELLSPGSIRARLEDRFALLVDGGTDLAARQQTLRSAIDWSFELLSPDQRSFFARLGVFAGSFDLEAALMVAGADLAAPLELLGSLVKHSMVARAGADRYRLLDTLRAYALEVLGELDADATRHRHADFYAGLAARGEAAIRGPEQLEWLDHLRRDINNFRGALEWCLLTGDTSRAASLAGDLAWFCTLNGMLTESIRYLERLVDADGVSGPARAKCLWGHALLAASLGRLEDGRASAHAAVTVARASEDVIGVAYGLNALAVTEWALGNHECSLAAHREGVELLEDVDDAWGLAICRVLQARTLFDVGDPTAAAVADVGVAQARRSGDLHVLGVALTQIAQMAVADGKPDAALAAAAEALELQERIGYTEGTVSALHVLGRSARLAGDLEGAADHHRRALTLAMRIGHAAATCEALEDLARIEADRRPDLARRLLRAARAERDRCGLPPRQRDAEELALLERAVAEDPLTHEPVSVSQVVAEMGS